MRKIIIYTIISLFFIACGASERLDIPISVQEKQFYEQLNRENFIVDSFRREISIGKMIKIISTDIIVKIYVDSLSLLKKNDIALIADEIANFNSKLVLQDNLKFDYCIINFKSDYKDGAYVYAYQFKDGEYSLW